MQNHRKKRKKAKFHHRKERKAISNNGISTAILREGRLLKQAQFETSKRWLNLHSKGREDY